MVGKVYLQAIIYEEHLGPRVKKDPLAVAAMDASLIMRGLESSQFGMRVEALRHECEGQRLPVSGES